MSADRRRHQRLSIRLPLVFRPSEASGVYTGRGVTANICAMGVCFESANDSTHPGMTLDLCITVPPAAGVSPYETEVSTTGRVIRLVRPASNRPGRLGAPERTTVAVRFNSPLQYDFPQ
jgi:hypothetical protein